MKIVLIGLGSIGQRHLRNLLQLGYKQVTVISRSGILPSDFASLPVFSSLTEALATSTFDAAIICTPTAFHTHSLLPLLQAKVPNIYIEKPVSHNWEQLNTILSLTTKYSNNIVVGFDLHFDLGLQKVKQLIQEGVIGQVISANAQVGQYLPDWRPQEDYKTGMSARTETGGGVMLDLVHEFDYLYWLLGKASHVSAQYINSGTLNIETEEVADVLVKFESGGSGTIHLDYLQPKLVRNCLLTGTSGSITWNLVENKVSWINSRKEEGEYDYKGFERNERFIQIIKAFLSGDRDERLTNLEQGLESLRWVLAAKKASDENIVVDLTKFQPA
ncbi:MAG: hypothetical protein JWQ96_3389 [Segetibacter sp.]|nr:hypothetical protein [Segetibacter sp.]